MSFLADSNILTRLTQKHSSHHPIARRALISLRKRGEEICIVPQNLIEFWSVATRPAVYNGLGLSVAEANLEIRKFIRLFKFYDDEPGIYGEWENLVAKYQVSGKNVHDARLVAAIIKHKITNLLTFNIKDFKRFTEISTVDPNYM